MDIPRGMLLVGQYLGVAEVKKATGEVVQGLFELRLGEPGRFEDEEATVYRASFNSHRRDTGEVTAVARALDELGLKVGDEIVVKVRESRNARGFTNRNIVSMARLDAPLKAVKGATA